VTTASTAASVAIVRRSGCSDEKRAAARLDRTTSDSSPESDTVIASGRLNARKSTAGSDRRIRNGITINLVVALATTDPERSPLDRQARRSCAMSSAVWYRSFGAFIIAR
jgi:hypothetical protein